MSGANTTRVFATPENPEPSELLLNIARMVEVTIRVAAPAKILTYNSGTNRAKVEVGFRQVVLTNANAANPDESETKPPRIVPDVPVKWEGGNKSRSTHPLKPGDFGELVCHDRDLTAWLLSGVSSDPTSAVAHAFAHGIFHPGLRPITTETPVDPAASVLEFDLLQKLGAAAVLGVARLSDKTSADASMTAWIALVTAALIPLVAAWTATQPAGGPLVAPGGTPLVPPVPPSDFGLISSASVKVVAE